MSTFTPMQQAFIAIMISEGNTAEAAEHAIRSGELYADAIDTACGGISTGSMGIEGEMDVPRLYLSEKEAQAEIDEEVERYEDEIAEGDRDEDDEYEGQLMCVFWGEDDYLYFYPSDSTGTDKDEAHNVQSCSRAMGH